MTAFVEMCSAARTATRTLAITARGEKDAALNAVAEALDSNRERIAKENVRDIEAARTRGTKDALVDRLLLDVGRIQAVAASVRSIASAHDPVGDVLEDRTRPNGLRVRRVRVPLGVIGMIYEARPSVTVEAAALCFKSGVFGMRFSSSWLPRMKECSRWCGPRAQSTW
jgi:glutamate-5-semialdehyde dehydrogenase